MTGSPGDPHAFVGRIVSLAQGDDVLLRPDDAAARAAAKALPAGMRCSMGTAVPTGFLAAEVAVDRWSSTAGVLMCVGPTNTTLLQRRQDVRVQVEVPVDVLRPVHHELVMVSTHTIDVSAGGLAVRPVLDLVPGSEVTVVVHLPSGPVVGVAEVHEHHQPGAGAGRTRLQLTQVAPADRARITAFANRTQAERPR